MNETDSIPKSFSLLTTYIVNFYVFFLVLFTSILLSQLKLLRGTNNKKDVVQYRTKYWHNYCSLSANVKLMGTLCKKQVGSLGMHMNKWIISTNLTADFYMNMENRILLEFIILLHVVVVSMKFQRESKSTQYMKIFIQYIEKRIHVL